MFAFLRRFLQKSQLNLFDYRPTHQETHHREGYTKHTASWATVTVAPTMAKVSVRGQEGEHVKPGQKVYYKTPNDTRKKKGHVVTVNHENGYHRIQPVRTGYDFKPDQINVHRDQIWTPEEHIAEGAKSGIREATSKGGSTIAVEESRRRAEVGQERSQLSEAEVLKNPEFVNRMRGTLAHLCRQNGYNPNYINENGVLHSDDTDANELYSEYITAAMNSFRTETSKASPEDIESFKNHLEGKGESRIMMSMNKAGKNAAMRHLVGNNERLRNEHSYDGTMEDDSESGMRAIAAKKHHVPEQEGDAANQARLAQGISDQLDDLDDPIAAAIIKMKFGLGRFEHGYKEADIAAALNRGGVRSEAIDKWNADAVKDHMQQALLRLGKTKSAKELLGFLKSVREHITLSKSEQVPQKTICVDFDGVLADYSNGFQGKDVFGEPLPGAAKGMQALRDAGYKVIIFTTREATPGLIGYLAFNDIPYDEINTNSDQPEGTNPGKCIADAYLDDRAIRFFDWQQALDDIDLFTKSLRADNLMDRFALIKSHIKQYTRQDGTVVTEHDDKRIRKHQDILKHQNEHQEEIHSGASIKHGNELMEHLRNRGWQERETHPVRKDESRQPGKKEDMPEPEEIKGENRENQALQSSERTMKKMHEAAKNSDDPVAVLQGANTTRGNNYLKAVDKHREKLLKHFGYDVDRNSTATKFDKDGHTIVMSKLGDKHTIHFAGGDPSKNKEAITSLQGKKEVQTTDTGKKEPKFIMGKGNKAYTAKMNEVKSHYALVDADDLTASHTIQGHVNKAYPQEIQPRERERLSSQMQMANMMNDIKPELFTAGNMAAHGAPIVGKDGAVESGNGRTIALTEAYKRGLADHYKDHLKETAADYGLKPEDVEKMKSPVLVRVRDDDDPNTDRAEFAREANDTGNLGSSPAEQAWTDAARIDDKLLKKFTVDEDGEIYNEDNMDFINGFLDKLGKNESAGLRDSDGDPNKKAIERIQNAVFTKVYGSSMLTELQAESAKPKIQKVLKALNSCVGDFAQVQGHDDLDVVPDMMEAIEYTLAHQSESRAELEHKLRNAGALDFTGDTPKFKTDFATDMILAVADRSGSRNRLENVFRAISNGIKDEVSSRENPEVDVFSGPAEPKTKQQVVKQALDKVSGDEVKKSFQHPVLTHLLVKSIGGNYGPDRAGKIRTEVGALEKSIDRGRQSGHQGQGKEDRRPGQEEKRTDREGRGGRHTHHTWLIKSGASFDYKTWEERTKDLPLVSRDRLRGGPEYTEDTCPECKGTDLRGFRGMTNDRACADCGCHWHYLDGKQVIGESHGLYRVCGHIQKSHVAAYDRTTKSGALSHVEAHEDGRIKRYAIKLGRTKNFLELHNLRRERFAHLPHWGNLPDHTKQQIIDAEEEVHQAHTSWEKFKADHMQDRGKDPLLDKLEGDHSGMKQIRLFKSICGIYLLRKGQLSLFDPHHIAYTRVNRFGTVSQIKAKGSPKPDGSGQQKAINFDAPPTKPALSTECTHNAFVDNGKILFDQITKFDLKAWEITHKELAGKLKDANNIHMALYNKFSAENRTLVEKIKGENPGIEKYWEHPDFRALNERYNKNPQRKDVREELSRLGDLSRAHNSKFDSLREQVLKHFTQSSDAETCQARADRICYKDVPGKHRRAIASFYAIVGTKGSALASLQVAETVKGKFRAHASEGRGAITLSDTDTMDTVWHECGHHIEYSHPDINKEARRFLRKRAQKDGVGREIIKPLNELDKTKRYKDEERAVKDKFISNYTGKVYMSGSTEIISMGMGMLAKSGEFRKALEKDPEWLHFTIGMLHYLKTKTS